MTKRNIITEDISNQAKRVKLILMDCDGVLTDGKLYYSSAGEEIKTFNVKDGQGIVTWHNAGFKSGIITGRSSTILKRRADELQMSFLKQNSENKVNDFNEIIEDLLIDPDEVAYIGDDIPDIELLKLVGFSVGVCDSADEVLENVSYKTSANGGYGAVREVIDLIIKCKSLKKFDSRLTS